MFDQIVPDGGKLTVVALVEKYISLKTGVRPSTEAGYKTVVNLLKEDEFVSNRRLSRAISADYFRRKHLSQSAVNEAKAHYIGCHRRLSWAYFSSAMAGLK